MFSFIFKISLARSLSVLLNFMVDHLFVSLAFSIYFSVLNFIDFFIIFYLQDFFPSSWFGFSFLFFIRQLSKSCPTYYTPSFLILSRENRQSLRHWFSPPFGISRFLTSLAASLVHEEHRKLTSVLLFEACTFQCLLLFVWHMMSRFYVCP